MRPKSIVVTSANSPFYFPVNWRGGNLGITATPSGAGNFDAAYTHEPIGEGAAGVGVWTDIDDMSGATAAASKVIGPCACLRFTLNSGDSVQFDIVQHDI
jgi:hypothetical protein